MYKKFDLYISDFSDDIRPGDYWYDCAIVEASEILNQFKELDWGCLFDNLNYKNIFWKIRLAECLGGLNNPCEVKIILELIKTDDPDLFVSCIDSLRTIDLSRLTKDELDNINDKISFAKENASLPVRCVLEAFTRKFISN
ncbi:hypothetical protein ACTV1L_003365 [Cronobacter turicensis]|uniref:hypothetical protein n=1 Tax=Cronobacter turicensis TaxID=413502 RepID=UPI0024AFA18C|nr:hypothetical protein [Cronobacter turicensis]ELU8456520.1 hypothetical protein [Cronobacter turicensis]EMA1793325.1 hypothetical protein [Cronobacter turicensis]EMA1803222.1 hypothetical protein [Cronobacter turicensis]EMA1850273.1 hypothetical protein [Cronobacter turicensis]EMA1859244.1 hypothetical protein [Cronobacter turicensis]